MDIDAVTATLTIDGVSPSSAAVRIVGEFDVSSTAASAADLQRLRRTPPQTLMIDTTETTFIDSSGLNALAKVASAVRQHGGSVTMIASMPTRRLVEMCGLRDHFGLDAAV